MTNGTALTAIHRAALNLVTEAQRCGVVVTIETTPRHPLAVGNYWMQASVRPARTPPPYANSYAGALSRELLGIVRTAQSQYKRLLQAAETATEQAQTKRDLSDSLEVIEHAVQNSLLSLTTPDSVDHARELQALRKKVATYEARDALGLPPPPATTYAPLTIDEARDLTCMLAGAPWPGEVLPELQRLLAIYDGLRAQGQRPVDPASLPRKVAKVVMRTGQLPAAGQQPAPSDAPAVDEPDEVTQLRALAATCYAGLGAECNLPENWLDALNAAANGEPFTTAGLLPFRAEPSPQANSLPEDAGRLEQIAEAIRDYHHALDMRKHGGLAESEAFSSICNTMGMHWNRGEEAARRAARKQGGA
ncbi:hypothetical protein [Acidovorax sp.]|uniref:hypothetical protein n=1 Tax=Acidovorax sp. TaxID=1872122 RepID=UPI0031CE4659